MKFFTLFSVWHPVCTLKEKNRIQKVSTYLFFFTRLLDYLTCKGEQ